MYCQDSLDYKENEMNKLKARCNLNGLLKREKQNKMMTSDFDYHEKEPKSSMLRIGDSVYRNLRKTCHENEVTLNSVLQFTWHKILSIYGNSNQTIIGTAVSGYGFFPLIVNHNMDNLIIDVVKNIQDKLNDMMSQSQQHFDLSLLQSKGKKVNHNLFDSLFVYENFSNIKLEQTEKKQKLLKVEKKYDTEKLDYPLVVVAYETVDKECVTFTIKYAGELFEEDTIDNLLDVANELLTQIGNNRVTKMADLNFLPPKQLNMINEWNNTDRELPLDKKQTTLDRLFEKEVEKSSGKVAVVYKNVQLTYGELNERANQLAHYLQSTVCEKIRPDDLIALLLDKSELMVVSILGVWKSSAAYVPIDPSYPDERIRFILQDTKAKLIITNNKYMNRLHSYNLIKIEIDSIQSTTKNGNKNSSKNLQPISSGNNLAYVTYTSGTTGKPNGVMKEHKSVINAVIGLTEKYNLSVNDDDLNSEQIVLFSEYVFEPFIRQFLMALLNSHTLVIIEQDELYDLSKFNLYSNKYKISYLNGTASLLQDYDYTGSKSLKRLLFAGEELTEYCFNKVRKTFKGTVINEYGPTESALVSTMKTFHFNENRINRSIGKPLMNVKCYVCDNCLHQLPIGAIGELYIGGTGVARSYLNRPELTAERFLSNPFQTEQEKKENKNARIYKTGDLVRWLPNGELEYLGRNDFQVKIRGLRIELGEIEAILSSYKGVKRSVVLAKDHKNKNMDTPSTKYLVGYYVSDNNADIAESDIKRFMQTKLPTYMIPNLLIRIEKIPTTINGKLDARALPDIDFSIDENNYSAPRNELEVKLCQLWSSLLGIDKIGITDDFFQLGGDSITSLQIVGRLRQEHGLNISIKDIFSFKTIEKLYDNKLKVQLDQSKSNDAVVDCNVNPAAAELVNTAIQETSSLTTSLLSVQQTYFITKKSFFHNNLNQYVLFRIPQFNENKFKDCLAKLVKHHVAFGIRFKKHSEGKYSQYYETNVDLEEINLVHIKNSESMKVTFETKLNDLLIKKIDLENGPTYMVVYSYERDDCEDDDGSAKVWFFMHHLTADFTSCCSITEELQQLYTCGSNSDIGSSNDSNDYKRWSNAIKSYVNNIEMSEKMYWQSILNAANLKIFNQTLADKQQTDNEISEIEITLTEEMSGDMPGDCNQTYNTQTEHLLLTALSYTLCNELSKLKENYIMFEGCCRNFANNLDMSRAIGMFRAIYPIQLQLADDDDDLRNSITNVKEHMKQVPNKGVGFGAISGSYKWNNDFPRVSFNYLGQFNNKKNGNKGNWQLLNGFCKNTMNENTKELVRINALIINEQMRLNIKTKIGNERTVQFAKALQFNIEKIIKHTQLISRCYLTRSDVNYIIKNNNYLNKIQLEKEVDAIFKANSLQKGLLYHSLKQSDVDDAYIVQSVFQYRTNINPHFLKAAWEHAQIRFGCLRLRFDWQEELVQIIDKKQALDWRFIDLTAAAAEEDDVLNQEIKIKQIEEEDRKERFKLDIGNLFRVYLIQQKSDLFVLIFSFHHIILDGWSLPILFDYVHQHYLNSIEGESTQLWPSSPLSPSASSSSSLFRDESYEKAQMYLQMHCHDNFDYWENEINKLEERCNLNGLLKGEKKNKVTLSQYDYVKESKARTLVICGNVYIKLKKWTYENGLTLNSILQFVWHKILSIYSNSSQTVTGTTVSGRNLPVDNIANSVGLFINTLPLIINHNTDNLILDAVKNIQDKMNEMISRSNVELTQLSKGKMKHSLFDSLFVYENYPNLKWSKQTAEQKQKVLKFEKKYDIEKLDYPLVVIAYETVDKECVTFMIKYAGELFEEDTIDNLLDVANELLTQIGNNRVTQMADLNFLPLKQLNKIAEWSNMDKEFTVSRKQITLHKLFEEEVQKSAEKVAVVYEDVKLTYSKLNEKANQLAHYLQSICNICPDDLIALFLDKSELMIVSILGVWKSGAAYVPIDPSYPDERISFILQDTKAKVIIANKKYMMRLNLYDIIKIEIEHTLVVVNQLTTSNGSMTLNPDSNTNEHNLAYVIYTSGTTGKPKGVLIEHYSVVSYRSDITSRIFDNYAHDEHQSILFFSNYVFDFSVEQLVLSILNSQTLIILANTFTSDDDRFYSYLNKNRLTYLSGTPTQLQQINLKELKYLKTLLIAGEPLTERLFEKIQQEYNGKIIAGYGVTETTVYNMVYMYQNGMKYKNTLGTPLSNTKIFVLNKNLQTLPVHAIGELYLTGSCMSRGYLNRPELTAERFLPNLFQMEQEKKEGKNTCIYKTGDLVRWLPNGELEYLGRNDFQVKIRGLRIELGEIEAVLSSYQGVKQSVVLAKDNCKKNKNNTDTSSTKYLVGYYVSDSNVDIFESDIKRFMQTKLPDYMIPNLLMRIERIPMTINGKLDARALPDIDFSINENNYSAPRNELEVELCQLWSNLLGIDKIGITDDFFQLGGDSISSLQLIGRIRKDLGFSVSIKDIFLFTTIKSLCDNVLTNRLKQKVKNNSLDCYEESTFPLSGEEVPVKSRLDSEKTTQFANSFKSELKDIIQKCSAKELPMNAVDYSNDFVKYPFVVCNDENSDNILFILPPSDGGAESYFRNIVPHLSSYKLVIFNNYYCDLKAKNMEKGFSFETLAPFYIKYIKQIQPNGPYSFLGWSFGGVLSFEISRQLNNAGDEIGNIFMIDSYFNLSKACFEIGKTNNGQHVIDEINYLYLPKIDTEAFGLNIANKKINIVLFKAKKLDDRLELYTYYSNTEFNHLDTLVNYKYIQLFQMDNDSHFSWVFNKEQIVKMCNYLRSVLNQ